jgi:hypothetical protein
VGCQEPRVIEREKAPVEVSSPALILCIAFQ